MKRLLHSELVKLTSTTWFVITAIAVIVLAPVSAITNVFQKGDAPLGSTDNVHHVLSSSALASMAMLAVGIAMMAGEHRHHTIVPTFLVTPRRREVVLAKVIVGGVIGLIVGAASFGLAAAGAVIAYRSKGIHHLAGDTAQMWIGAAIAPAAYAAIGVALGAITRSVVAAIIAALVWVQFVEASLLASALPSLGKWLPTGANLAITRTAANLDELLPPIPATFVLLAWTVALCAVADWFVTSRDV